jgi:hypothetical protein
VARGGHCRQRPSCPAQSCAVTRCHDCDQRTETRYVRQLRQRAHDREPGEPAGVRFPADSPGPQPLSGADPLAQNRVICVSAKVVRIPFTHCRSGMGGIRNCRSRCAQSRAVLGLARAAGCDGGADRRRASSLAEPAARMDDCPTEAAIRGLVVVSKPGRCSRSRSAGIPRS